MGGRDQILKDSRVVAPALVLTAAFATWATSVISEKSWLYALVIAALGIADLPLVARVGRRSGWILALLIHAGVLVVESSVGQRPE